MKVKMAIKKAMVKYNCETYSQLSKKLFPDKNKNYLHCIIANEKNGTIVSERTINNLEKGGIDIDYKDESGLIVEIVSNNNVKRNNIKNKKGNILEFKSTKLINNELYISFNEIKSFLPKAG